MLLSTFLRVCNQFHTAYSVLQLLYSRNYALQPIGDNLNVIGLRQKTLVLL